MKITPKQSIRVILLLALSAAFFIYKSFTNTKEEYLLGIKLSLEETKIYYIVISCLLILLIIAFLFLTYYLNKKIDKLSGNFIEYYKYVLRYNKLNDLYSKIMISRTLRMQIIVQITIVIMDILFLISFKNIVVVNNIFEVITIILINTLLFFVSYKSIYNSWKFKNDDSYQQLKSDYNSDIEPQSNSYINNIEINEKIKKLKKKNLLYVFISFVCILLNLMFLN